MRLRNSRNFKKITEADKARLAMAIDTDGCISSFHLYRKTGEYATPTFQFIGYSSLPVELARLYGGTVAESRGRGVFRWLIIAQKELRDFLLATEPYVILKRKQVAIALSMLDVLKWKRENWREKSLLLGEKLSTVNSAYKRPRLDLNTFRYEDYRKLALTKYFSEG